MSYDLNIFQIIKDIADNIIDMNKIHFQKDSSCKKNILYLCSKHTNYNKCQKYIFVLLNLMFFFAIFVTTTQDANAYMVKYKEDWYKLFHVHYQQYPDDCIENIYWLERAAQADFCNPLWAYAKIRDESDWEKYRYLFQMHLNLKLIEQHLRLGRTYDKRVAYFYDAPYKDFYVENLDKALTCYHTARFYWIEAQNWAEKANAHEFQFLTLQDVQFWEDEKTRITTGELDYKKMLDREITRVESVKAKFLSMDKDY